MSKKGKPQKGSASGNKGGYKKFIIDLSNTLKKLDLEKDGLSKMSAHDKRMMWGYKWVIRGAKKGNQNITNAEIKNIAEQARHYFYKQGGEIEGVSISCYELLLLNCYAQGMARKFREVADGENDPDMEQIDDLKDLASGEFYKQYFLNYYKVLIRLSNPGKRFFGVDIRSAYIFKDSPSLELVTSLHKFNPIKKYIELHGIKRPAFRLAKPIAHGPLEWISAPKDLVKGFYTGDKDELEVYIQPHALKRMSERLDALSKEAVNYILWENTTGFDDFMTYKDYLFLPIKIHKIKIGYLLANIVDDIILFRTFLFITHNSTPEGDKLKQISGLGKHDISYWHIDRLSTLLNFEEEKYPGLGKLFQEAGIGNISELKEKELDIETLQEANLNGLEEYIRQGQLELA